ncbi:hypothetical protein BDP27DRAFT_757021 [Rhodocollybia butyracea]|uniref:Uncharacterized protein n=1 Tax=Rhodocollybia butyracea TaxID=206335 RepID=A0A9P5PTC9_9AGAR|nr:hypothetical protein BDP27DRAFT_757021 [Rhodocollybia butyracea]
MSQASTLKSWNGAHFSSVSSESPPNVGKEHDGIIEALTSSWHNDSLIPVTPAEKLDGLAQFERNLTSATDISLSTSENQTEITTETHSAQLENLDARMPAASKSTEHVRSSRHSVDRVLPESSQTRPNRQEPLLSPDTVRDLVLPLLLKNVTLRGGKDHSSESILQATNKVLSENACQNIALQMAEAQRQLSQARVLDTRSMAGDGITNGDVVVARSGSPQSIRVSNSPTVVNDVTPQASERERSNSLGVGHVDGEDVQSSDWIPLKRRRLDLDSRYSSESLSHQRLVSPMALQQNSVRNGILSRSEAINGVTPYPNHGLQLNGNGLHSESFDDSPVASYSPTQTPQINGSSSIHHSLPNYLVHLMIKHLQYLIHLFLLQQNQQPCHSFQPHIHPQMA